MAAFTPINELPPHLTKDHYRRPYTSDSSKFWHITQAKWDALFVELDAALAEEKVATANNKRIDKNKRNVILNNIRKFDQPGRMMETPEGVPAPNPDGCLACSKAGHGYACMVLQSGETKSCAYCRRMGKSGCKAGEDPPPSSPERTNATTNAYRTQEMGEECEDIGAEDGRMDQLRDRMGLLEVSNTSVGEILGQLQELCGQQAGEIQELRSEVAELRMETHEIEDLRRQVAGFEDMRSQLAEARSQLAGLWDRIMPENHHVGFRAASLYQAQAE